MKLFHKFIIRIFTLLLSVSFVLILFSGCTQPENVSRDGFYFDTYIRISIYAAPDRDAALDAAFELCGRYDKLFDKNNSESDISKINDGGGQPVQVDDETIGLLEKGLEYCRMSDGLFDITCGRVTKLWDFSTGSSSLPDGPELAAALETVNWKSVQLDRNNNTVTVPDGVHIDVGGIAKGYIADRICAGLRNMRCTGAIINLGGNVYALGSKNGKPFNVGIQSPFDSDRYMETVAVNDRSVVTAGSYQRCFTLDGKLYHHILDLSDGMPAETGIASVTIISDSSADGDALSTICFLLGEQGTEELFKRLDGSFEAYIVLTGGEVRHITSVADSN